MNTDQDRGAEILGRRLHQLVDDVVEQPDALERIMARTVHSDGMPTDRAAGRTRFRILAAAAAAAVLAGGVYLAQPHDNANGSGQATASPGQQVRLTASEVLYRVATVADTTMSVPPRSDQYEYLKLVERTGGRTRTVEQWVPQSPTTAGLVHRDGKFGYVIAAWDTGRTAAATGVYPDYAFLASLPTDPATVLQAIDANGKHPGPGMTAAQTSFANVVGLVGNQILPPKLAAAIYRALATLPGISVDQDVVDAAGRHGVGVGMTYADGMRSELIFDRTDFTLMGTSVVPPANTSAPHAGQTTFAGPSLDAIIEQRIVDSAGQTPAN